MKKNLLPVALLLGGGFFLYNYLKGKKDSLQNLQYIPMDIAIDAEKTKKDNYLFLHYRIILKLVNDGTQNVNVNGVNLSASFANQVVATLNNNSVFRVPAKDNKTIELTSKISTVNLVSSVVTLLRSTAKIPVVVSGTILTDLGTVTVNFTKDLTNPF
jgi:hypothetical protein